MKKIDLSVFETEDLKSLQNNIKEELIRRGDKKRKYGGSIMRRIMIIHGMKPKDYSSEDKELIEIRLFNSHFLCELPERRKGSPYEWEPYLSSLINQDWMALYPRETEIGEYYVYAHVDPRNKPFITSEDAGGNYGGRPFYIGKGIDNRAFDLKRNEGHGKTIKEILTNKWPSSSIVNILFKGLSEQKALEIESKLIYFFGTQFSMIEKGWLVNLTQPPIPEFVTSMKKMPTYAEQPAVDVS